MISCGPCGNVICSTQGCIKQRNVFQPGGIQVQPMGCICPPTSERTCGNERCPRKSQLVTVTYGQLSIASAPQWPHNGYAPGKYYCNCVSCQKKFDGDKRAYRCPKCAGVPEGWLPVNQIDVAKTATSMHDGGVHTEQGTEE